MFVEFVNLSTSLKKFLETIESDLTLEIFDIMNELLSNETLNNILNNFDDRDFNAMNEALEEYYDKDFVSKKDLRAFRYV